jgi:phosphotriesterase-related protein
MTSVNTVRGPIDASALGVTLMHEHICLAFGPPPEPPPSRRGLLDEAARKLTAAKALGIDTVVDATPIDLDRDAAFLRESSEESGVHVVCSTGLYTEHHGQPEPYRSMSVQEKVDLFVHEITEGIGDTGIRAGVLKCAIGEGGISPLEAATLEAVANAQTRTGVPVITHTSGGGGLEQAKLLTGAGADPKRVMIGHVDHKYSSYSYYERILRTGVNIAFDRCGLQPFMPDSIRAALIAGLVDVGHQDRVFLSMDSICARIGEPSEFERDAPEPLVHLMTTFADLLDRYGVDRATFETILTANPARLFTSEAAAPGG